MSDSTSSPDMDTSEFSPQRTLTVLRLLWTLLLSGQVLFGVSAFIVIDRGHLPRQAPAAVMMMVAAACGVFVVCVLLGVYLRSQIYKRNWQGSVITPKGYFTGNLVMLALLQGVVLLGLVVYVMAGGFWPGVVPAALGLAVYMVNYPHGGPMFGMTEPASIAAGRDEK